MCKTSLSIWAEADTCFDSYMKKPLTLLWDIYNQNMQNYCNIKSASLGLGDIKKAKKKRKKKKVNIIKKKRQMSTQNTLQIYSTILSQQCHQFNLNPKEKANAIEALQINNSPGLVHHPFTTTSTLNTFAAPHEDRVEEKWNGFSSSALPEASASSHCCKL